MTVAPNDITTPRGLKMGKRLRKNGKTIMQYKQGKHFDELTAKQVVECIEGYAIKDLIIIPAEDSAS